MGYRRGYDCDICGKSSEKEGDFIGFESVDTGCSHSIAADSADFHICLACARVISQAIIEWNNGAERRQRILNGETPLAPDNTAPKLPLPTVSAPSSAPSVEGSSPTTSPP